ncbi:hypothetical protein CKO_02072 [Citrobacter koseri ATCC BAA-895]|uniref:Uncharacterized protein n=1 Tax=Citrobacter koseri (strain ATCC BAA-895 / CDC 4225-83 / SGSC4696) TaxID=290338 RepID=A8AI83_CITK8|nr:hypothetical protein CKO_02072 [Citrobacter koseri ATCC BAA-895]
MCRPAPGRCISPVIPRQFTADGAWSTLPARSFHPTHDLYFPVNMYSECHYATAVPGGRI